MSKSRQQGFMSSTLNSAIAHHQAGRLEQAEALYRQHPNNPDALNLLGVIAYQRARYDDAVTLIRKAIRAKPGDASFHYNLGLVQRALGRVEDARNCYEQAVRLQPRYTDAINNLGVLLREQGLAEAAANCYRKVIAFNPAHVEALNNLGAVLREQGKQADALTHCRQALALDPAHVGAFVNMAALLNDAGSPGQSLEFSARALALDPHCFDAHNNMGASLEDLGRFAEAEAAYRQALALRPSSADQYFNLGRVLQKLARNDDALACFEQAVQHDPRHAEAHNSAGALLLAQGKLGAAMRSLQQALALRGPGGGVLTNIGTTLLNQGKLDEAIATLRDAARQDPHDAVAQANLLFAHNYHPSLPAADIFELYRAWDREHALALTGALPHCLNTPDPGRRLKVGYVSADLRQHTVMLFAGPLIESHDRAQVEVFCYHNSFSFDGQSARLKAAVDQWVPCAHMSDDELAASIRADAIDVLIDLSGHTAGNRLLVFARKAAPVQVSWMGFGYTTGLSAMDYFMGDAYFTPPGCEALFSETIYRLPQAPWAFRPQAEAPAPGQLPARTRGYVTFGCVSTTTRIHAPLFDAWAAILRRLPDARLRLDTRNLRDPELAAQYVSQFAQRGVPASQLEVAFTSPVWQVYQDVDIILDCFPHNSGTTTCEALWMGLPVVTLADRPSVGRFGASILAAVGRQEWVADSATGYVELAVALAADIDSLERVRATLRGAVSASSLLDHAGFARSMETAYRDMWQRWCAAHRDDPRQSLELALEHHRAGRLQEAETLYASLPPDPAVLHLLGIVAAQTGRHALAIERLERAIEASPDQASCYCNLGSSYAALGRHAEAITAFEQALALDPTYAMACNNLGNALRECGKPEAAIASLQRALALQPDYADAYNNLGSVYKSLGRLDEAVACYRSALERAPALAVAHFNLGNALHAQVHLNAAIDSFLAALELDPAMVMAHNNLGLVLKDIGKLDDALTCFRNALTLVPDDVNANSNLLYCVNYHPTMPAQDIFAAYQAWDARQAARLAGAMLPAANVRDPARRLRVGYLSADLRHHSVIFFAGPLIEQHDKAAVEVFCYYNQSVQDAYTERMIAAADHWLACQDMSDEALAARIRADGIDVLVDLSGHTLGNRLLVYARKPAPVQVSWLGFGYTTGLRAMDYFIGDAHFTPPGSDELFSETVYRLPRACWSYEPPAAPDPGPLPARARGHVTFACVSTTVRLQECVIEAWAAILRRLPQARLRLDTRNFSDPDLCREMEAHFARHGVAADRLQIGFTSPVWQVYQEVDIVLDCFPHNCGTTTLEALWMGLPVVSVKDRPSMGRIGDSVLSALGKEGWVAENIPGYVELAVALAQDIDALEHERRTLRRQMQASPLQDHAGFARAMEAAYRAMWQHWCQQGSST